MRFCCNPHPSFILFGQHAFGNGFNRFNTADFLGDFHTQILACLVSTHLKTDSRQLTRGCRVYTADGLSRLLSVLVWILPFNKRRLAKPLGMNNRSKKCKFVLTCWLVLKKPSVFPFFSAGLSSALSTILLCLASSYKRPHTKVSNAVLSSWLLPVKKFFKQRFWLLVNVGKTWWQLVGSVTVCIQWRTTPIHLTRGFNPTPISKIQFEWTCIFDARGFPKWMFSLIILKWSHQFWCCIYVVCSINVSHSDPCTCLNWDLLLLV